MVAIDASEAAGRLLHVAFNGSACELKQAAVASAGGLFCVQFDVTKLAIQHMEVAQRYVYDDIAMCQAVLQHALQLLQQMDGLVSGPIRVQLRPVNMPGLLCTDLADVHHALRPGSSSNIVVLRGRVVSLGSAQTSIYSRALTCQACGQTSHMLAGQDWSSSPCCCSAAQTCTEVTEARQVQSCQTVGLRVADAAGTQDLSLCVLDDDLVGAFTLGQHLEVIARVSWLAPKPRPGAQLSPTLRVRVFNATACSMPVLRAASGGCRPAVLAAAAAACEPKALQGVVDLLVSALGRDPQSSYAAGGWVTWVGMLLSACCIGEPPRQSKTVKDELHRCQVNLCWLFDGSPALARLIRRAAELLAPSHRQIGATTQLPPSVTTGAVGATLHAGALHELSEGLLLSADLATLTKPQLTTLEHFLMHTHTHAADGVQPQPNTATCWMLMDASAAESRGTPAAESISLDAACRQLGCKLLHRVDLVLSFQGQQSRTDGCVERACDELLNASGERADASKRAAATALQEHIVRAAACPRPSMSEDAMDLLQSYYMSARSHAPGRGVCEAPMALLSSIVRLSMASARLRLQEDVLPFDALLAIRLVEESACVGSDWTRPPLLDSALMGRAGGMPLDAYVELLEDTIVAPTAATDKTVPMDLIEE